MRLAVTLAITIAVTMFSVASPTIALPIGNVNEPSLSLRGKVEPEDTLIRQSATSDVPPPSSEPGLVGRVGHLTFDVEAGPMLMIYDQGWPSSFMMPMMGGPHRVSGLLRKHRR
jgi:hypothetical protein